jgi:hypothetical protein
MNAKKIYILKLGFRQFYWHVCVSIFNAAALVKDAS